MEQDETSFIALLAIAFVAVLGLGLALASFATDESVPRMMGSGGGGMMSQPAATSTPGPLEWGILLVSAACLVITVALMLRMRRARSLTPAGMPAAVSVPVVDRQPVPSPDGTAPPSSTVAEAAPEPVPELTLVKLLNEDERRMYLELRDHGGEMLQRDLVALGMFSKAKVTRVLDKLESKGIIVREAHGMTNRVRLVAGAAR